jgi:DNA-binding transcriptional ArsR family regulator
MVEENKKPDIPRPDTEFVINDLETLKALTDTLRMQILGYLRFPRTVKQLANELKTTPGKLYYHINLLEEKGLLRVVDTRVVSGIIEKQYQVVALKFPTNPNLFSLEAEDKQLANFNVYIDSMLDTTRDEIKQSAAAGLIDFERKERHRTLLSAKGFLKLTPEEAEQFYRRLADIVKEMQGKDTDDEPPENCNWYGVSLLMYPASTPEEKALTAENAEDL